MQGKEPSTTGHQRLAPASELLDIQRLWPVFIIGRSGSGKHLYTTMYITDYLARGKTVLILDSGMSYRKICETAGGRYVYLQGNGRFSDESFGDAPLTVLDFEQVWSYWGGALPELPPRGALADGGLVVVDETFFLLRTAPALVSTVADLVEAGAAFCITGQSADDLAPFRGLHALSRTIEVSAA